MTKEEVNNVVNEAKEGSQKAFTLLYNLHYNSIYNNIYRITKDKELAEDLCQDAFTRAFTKLDKYTTQLSFEMWLKTIATNITIDFLRKHSKISNSTVDAEDELKNRSSTEDGPEEMLIEKEKREIFNENVKKLGNRMRTVVSMRYNDGLSYKEIAEELKINVGTVKSYISKATNKVKPN